MSVEGTQFAESWNLELYEYSSAEGFYFKFSPDISYYNISLSLVGVA